MQRYAQPFSLPAYSYVPGRFPHPQSDPQGHSYQKTNPFIGHLTPSQVLEREEFLQGVDLFNHGYYWESHEQWELIWKAIGQRGTMGCFLKGLIKLAACGVKAREEIPHGTAHHARRGADLLELCREKQVIMSRVNLDALIEAARKVEGDPESIFNGSPELVVVVWKVPIEIRTANNVL
ncbi:MAG: DUF309 domain-containing protein [Pirellulaceae bacterium]